MQTKQTQLESKVKEAQELIDKSFDSLTNKEYFKIYYLMMFFQGFFYDLDNNKIESGFNRIANESLEINKLEELKTYGVKTLNFYLGAYERKILDNKENKKQSWIQY